jgi:hypothetical protein
MVTLMGVFRKYLVFQKVTSYKNGDKYKLTSMSNVKSEFTITKDHFTTFPSEMTLMYEISWPPLYIHGKSARVEHVMKNGISEFDVSKF